MTARMLVASLLTFSLASAGALAQSAPAPEPASVARDVKGLSADDFAEREAALKRLQTLVAEQLKQRAQIQEVLSALQADLIRQQHDLTLVSDEEAQAQIAGLLEMERGLSAWTIQTMGESPDRRRQLLAWGLTKENGPILAHVYAEGLRVRLDGIKQLAKLNDDGANWTLSRLINDRQTAVRAGAMAVCWSRKPSADVVTALWFRAVTGPLAMGDVNGGPTGFEGRFGGGMPMPVDIAGFAMPDNMVKVDFPGGDPMMFDDASEANQFFDSQLASDVLVHLNSPLVGDRIKALVDDRAKAGKTLSLNSDPDWTLVTHRLVETYSVKEAIPLLAAEALGADSEDMGGDFNGRPFMWSRRTMAIGTLAKLIGKQASDFDLILARDGGDPRGWMWAVEVTQQQMMNGIQQSDGASVRAFYAFWKDHHAEYGVKDAPSNAFVPPVQPPGRPNRFRNQPGPDGPPVIPMPAVGPAGMPGAMPDGDVAPEGGPDAPQSTPPAPPQPAQPAQPFVRPMPLIRGGAAG